MTRCAGSEGRLGEIAARQRDVVTRAQLTEAGLGRGGIDARIAAGRLQRLHRGVYFVGFAPPGALIGSSEATNSAISGESVGAQRMLTCAMGSPIEPIGEAQ